MAYRLTKATVEEAPLLAGMYREGIGSPGCIWNEEYPTLEDAENDTRLGRAYVLRDEADRILAACSLEGDEIREQPFCPDKAASSWEVSRVVVAKAYRGQGLARQMLTALCAQLAQEGLQYLRLLVSPRNLPACATYFGLGFRQIGECDLYEEHWLACEKKLSD